MPTSLVIVLHDLLGHTLHALTKQSFPKSFQYDKRVPGISMSNIKLRKVQLFGTNMIGYFRDKVL